ncbi:MATE family efflux transporter [Novosphingobium terrae]|uniref:MATE family efflux transporter n=1 Tax=Novosphingobium terrae TaxID=2726189 RepID=UPI00197CDEE6|nr:MATE family efflux transporter [Novosphingobium terrae]
MTTASPFRTELRETLKLALPLAAANMLQMAVYAIDVIFVARLGQSQLATSSLAVSLFGLLAWSFCGLTGAVAPIIAAELGRRRHAVREVRRSVRMALWLSVACGLVGMALCMAGTRFFQLTGEPPHLAEQAGAFMRILQWAMVPLVAANVLRTFVSTLGRPVFATAITALSIGVNAAGNYALVFGHWGAPALGLSGSGIASVITACITLLAYALVILSDRRLRRYRIMGHWWRIESTRLLEILKLGLPIFSTVLAEAGLFGGAAFLMGRIGELELAAHAVALQVAAFTFQLPMGLGQAATIRVGYHYGARDVAAMGRAGWAAIAVGLGIACISSSAMLGMPVTILSAYVDTTAVANAAMVALAVRYLSVAAAFQLVDAAQAVAQGALRGLQDTRWPMTIALLGYWLPGFGTAVVLGFFTPLRGMGVWIGLATGLAVVATLLLIRWSRRETLRLTVAR